MPRPVANPPNPWHSAHVEWLGEPPAAELSVYEERARSVLSANDSPDLAFRYSVNPYRGCFHGCSYCYARPTHQYLDWGAGTDFERRLVVKVNAPEVLARELARPALRGQTIVFSGNTDCYQPLEAHYGLTRRCLEVCLARRQPVALVTKAALVRRDVDVLAALAKRTRCRVFVSLAFRDSAVARAVEPFAPSPKKRLEALAALSAAGVPTGIALAPLIPALNEADVPELLERAHAAGARQAFLTLLRLSGPVHEVFVTRLAEAFPDRARHVLAALDDVRAGDRREGRFHERMRGRGARWAMTEQLFRTTCRRLGIATGDGVQAPPGPRERQLGLPWA